MSVIVDKYVFEYPFFEYLFEVELQQGVWVSTDDDYTGGPVRVRVRFPPFTVTLDADEAIRADRARLEREEGPPWWPATHELIDHAREQIFSQVAKHLLKYGGATVRAALVEDAGGDSGERR